MPKKTVEDHDGEMGKHLGRIMRAKGPRAKNEAVFASIDGQVLDLIEEVKAVPTVAEAVAAIEAWRARAMTMKPLMMAIDLGA